MTAIITNPYKERSFREYPKGFSGHRFERSGNEHELNELGEKDYAHEMRCRFCGRWFIYHYKDKFQIMREGRWEFDRDRAAHCGNSSCDDFYRAYLIAEETRAKVQEDLYLQNLNKDDPMDVIKYKRGVRNTYKKIINQEEELKELIA
jgi:hypothetical protein